jgi:molecular chaperone HscA
MAKISINLATGTIQQEELIVGIDLGTTNSLIAIIHPQTKDAIAIKDIDQSALVPSVIHVTESNDILVGTSAKPFLETDPENTIYSIKRLMGKSYQDIHQQANHLPYQMVKEESEKLLKIKIRDKYYNPIELSSFILKELKIRAEHILKLPISKCVITVPAYFNDAQRQATRDAGKLAGLDVLRIINEPTAASLAYGIGMQKNEIKHIAVYDLGGGTFDISILKVEDGVFDVLSTNGDTYLGGDDIDRIITENFYAQIGMTEATIASDKSLQQKIRLTAEEAKKSLSVHTSFSTNLHGKEIHLTRLAFEEIIKDILQRTIQCCKQALKDSTLSKEQIDEIIMVGGSTRIPAIKQTVSDFFGKPIFDSINPDEVVALGAAIQADILAGNNQDVLLLDVTPLSLGIETMGGLMDVLIPRNAKIPCKASRQYSTQKDGQTGIVISVFQGERDLVKDNRLLANFTLSGIPAMPAGIPKVDIQCLINADGILQVTAKELRSGVEQTIDIKPQYGLTDSDVEAMLLDSMLHAKSDVDLRALTESITEAEQMIQLSENFMFKHQEWIQTEELKFTRRAIEDLQKAILTKDKQQIIYCTEALNKITTPYAERVMDIAIAEALKGKTV